MAGFVGIRIGVCLLVNVKLSDCLPLRFVDLPRRGDCGESVKKNSFSRRQAAAHSGCAAFQNSQQFGV
jgi:hypothetical protein